MPENSLCVGFRLGVFTIDLRGRSLLRENRAILLPARAFDALLFLVTHRDRIVEKATDNAVQRGAGADLA